MPVAIVGAGPGDPELITLRGARRLAGAQVVLHDALVSPELRALAPRARWIYVGKRARTKSISQAAIERCLVREARSGRRVVRLKGGDPFVLGRGGEEALALAAAGIPFEVVPGVSSAVAAPALAGIPVTHRGLSSSFVVVAGHAPATFEPVLGSLAPRSATVVVLMGLAQRAAIARLLLARGWGQDLPAAVLLAAGTHEREAWTGRLDELAGAEIPGAAGKPGTIVAGEVVSLARVLGGAGVSPVRSRAGETPTPPVPSSRRTLT